MTPAEETNRPPARRRARRLTFDLLSKIFAVECSRHLALELERRTHSQKHANEKGAAAFHGMMEEKELRPTLLPYCPTEEEQGSRSRPPVAILVNGEGTLRIHILPTQTVEEFKALVAEVFGNDAAGLPEQEAMRAHRPYLILTLYIYGPSNWRLKPEDLAKIDAWGTAPPPWTPVVIPHDRSGRYGDSN
jgi:hypothetical protein